MYITIQTSLIPTAVVSTHGDPGLADSVPGAENHVMQDSASTTGVLCLQAYTSMPGYPEPP